MKIPVIVTCLLAAVLSALPMSHARADDVSFDVFYNNLADDGDWYNTPSFGYVWHPNVANDNDKWRPYSDGYWAQTDDGWTWVSYENFGWATYHYGRWTRLESVGWVWVPGYDWGPGWVSWRTNDDYVGWAPLPPKRELVSGDGGPAAVVDYNTVETDTGYDNGVDEQYDIGPDNYCFVQTRDFGAPVLREVLIAPQQNIIIIQNTVNVTRISYQHSGDRVFVMNQGPDFEFLTHHSNRPIQRLRLDFRGDPGFLRDGARSGHNPNVMRDGVLQVAAPSIAHRPANFADMKPPRVRQDISSPKVEHGWRNTGADPQTVQRVRQQVQDQGRQRATRPPAPVAGAAVPPANDPRQREHTNLVPTPAGTPATPTAPHGPTRDAHPNGAQPTPGAPVPQHPGATPKAPGRPGATPLGEPTRETPPRRPGAQDQHAPTVAPAAPSAEATRETPPRRPGAPEQHGPPGAPTASAPGAPTAPNAAATDAAREPRRQPTHAPAATPAGSPREDEAQQPHETRRPQHAPDQGAATPARNAAAEGERHAPAAQANEPSHQTPRAEERRPQVQPHPQAAPEESKADDKKRKPDQ